MVEQGFRVTAEKKFGGGTSAFSPAADWHGKYTNEWVFYYNRCASLYTYTHALPVFCVGVHRQVFDWTRPNHCHTGHKEQHTGLQCYVGRA